MPPVAVLLRTLLGSLPIPPGLLLILLDSLLVPSELASAPALATIAATPAWALIGVSLAIQGAGCA